MRKPQKTSAELAKTYNCHVRTIRGWKREKAPLYDPKAMRQWLANRKNLPPNLPPLVDASAAGQDLAATIGTERTGAPAALDRLQRAEVAAFERLQKAQVSRKQDPVLIRGARQEWLRLLEALRHYERTVAMDRRDCGDLIERSQVAQEIGLLGQAARMTFEGMLPRLADNILACEQDPIRCRQLLRRANWYAHIGSLSVGYASRLPEWLLKAWTSDLQDALTHGDTMHPDAKKIAEIMNDFGMGLALAVIRDTPPVPDKPTPQPTETAAQA